MVSEVVCFELLYNSTILSLGIQPNLRLCGQARACGTSGDRQTSAKHMNRQKAG